MSIRQLDTLTCGTFTFTNTLSIFFLIILALPLPQYKISRVYKSVKFILLNRSYFQNEKVYLNFITEANFLPGEETLSLSKYLYHFIRYRWNFILHVAFPPSRCGYLFLLTTSLHANQLMENRGMRHS